MTCEFQNIAQGLQAFKNKALKLILTLKSFLSNVCETKHLL